MKTWSGRVHSTWLSETGASLGTSLKDVLDLNDPEKLPVQANLLLQLESPQALARARQRSQRILKTIAGELETAPWYDGVAGQAAEPGCRALRPGLQSLAGLVPGGARAASVRTISSGPLAPGEGPSHRRPAAKRPKPSFRF